MMDFLLLSSSLALFLSVSQALNHNFSDCAPVQYTCGELTLNITYPFLVADRSPNCGHPSFFLICKHDALMIPINGREFEVRNVSYENYLLSVVDTDFVGQTCPQTFHNTTIDSLLFAFGQTDRNLSLYFNCTSPLDIPAFYDIGCLMGLFGRHAYYRLDNESFVNVFGVCKSMAVVPLDAEVANELQEGNINLTGALQKGFSLEWKPGNEWCSDCMNSGGHCGYDSNNPDDHTCFCSNSTVLGSCSSGKSSDNGKWIGVGVGAGAGGFILASTLCFLWFRRKKRQQFIASSALIGSASSEPFSGTDPELGGSVANYQTHLFSYAELQEATNCFDASRELGDGGYGTVYKGKLRDGRVVAVKRLYENNYKRVEQFMNEIAILSRLRHQNLVTLYGCTSHQSRELLLVYEYVPNGTVADHLHGGRAPDGALDWPVRLRIAIETADALSYLHAVDPPIIHRDVKTSNILLDGGFRVKVADFGLSRLFPTDATHVSTAPQGTPGYLDPEYHQCYQLTDKSDVYSFGVVLVELISSKPAVDITRHRHEINLAAMAITKIQSNKLEQLVDPALGYNANCDVQRMITQVAELAFRCLQAEREMRPAIREVVEVLRHIESGGIDAETDALMNKKNVAPFSPDSVTERWASRSTTPPNSG